MVNCQCSKKSLMNPLMLAIYSLCGALALAEAPGRVEWLTPTTEPGTGSYNIKTYQGSMPLGNGALTASAWANVSSGGVGVMLGHQNGQSSATELFKLGLLQVSLSPNPFLAGNYFNQSLDISTATLFVHAGGSSLDDCAVTLSVWCDANNDALYVSAAACNGVTPYTLNATLSSVRPPTPLNYTADYASCTPLHTEPDVFVDPLPPPVHLAAPPPQSPLDAMRHASGPRLPTRLLHQGGRLPPTAAFSPATLIVYHRNMDTDGLTVPDTLTQQGLASIVPTTPDHWRDNQFGLALDGGGGGGLLVRTSPSTLTSAAPAPSFLLRATALAVQTVTVDAWFVELAALVAASPSEPPRAAHEAWWAGFWGRSHVRIGNGTAAAQALNVKYELSRYMNAVESRGTIFPVKFNGNAFTAAMVQPSNAQKGASASDSRWWGPSNWFQNTRLPYGAMLLAGDFDLMRVILDYMTNAAVFLRQRTQLYWNHSGIWTTETHHLTGAYDQPDYGCSGREGWPVWLMQSGYLKVDWGGNSGTGEYALMALDFYTWTGNAQYLPLAFSAADFLMQHFTNRSAEGRVVVWPAQILESYWCDFDAVHGVFTAACCADDTPTVSAMLSLFPRLLALPTALTTPAQVAAWGAFAAILPALPLSPDGTSILPGRIVENGGHNNEGPELYVAHPHRLITKGRATVDSSVNLTAAVHTLHTHPWYNQDNTWCYGINEAVLLGETAFATNILTQKAASGPPPGYRFEGYAPDTGDYDPSGEYYVVMNRALQEMILQSGEDGYEATTLVLFPAWDCTWDVSAKLWGPLNTTVEIEYAGGVLQSLVVTPPTRLAQVKWAGCVNQTRGGEGEGGGGERGADGRTGPPPS